MVIHSFSSGRSAGILSFSEDGCTKRQKLTALQQQGGLDPSGNDGREPTITYRSIDVSQRTAVCGRVAAANGASVGLAQATQLVAVSSAAYPRHLGAQQGSASTFPSIEAQRTMVR